MSRKDDHIALALKQTEVSNDFDRIQIIHHSLTAIDVDTVNCSTEIGTMHLDYPFYINAMTGGSDFTNKINQDLAYVASRTGLMMAVGSMSSMLKDSNFIGDYKLLREINPTGLILANLNLNHSLDDARLCLDVLKADGIQFHLNSPQEITMPEGDRHFSHWLDRIKEINTLNTNVIVKEVGFGMSKKTIKQLVELNTKIIDVSGKGGTNFVNIESSRNNNTFNYLNDWGQSTVESLMNAKDYLDNTTFLASGGIRNPLDIIKALVLKASAVGVSKAILKSLIEDGVEDTISLIISWQEQIKLLMALVGARTVEDLHKVDYIVK